MAIRNEAFIALESSLAARLVKGWQEIARDLLPRIHAAVTAGDFDTAIALATGVNLDPVFESNKPYIKYHTFAALFFGATRLTEKPGDTVIARGDYNDFAQEVSDNFQFQVKAMENSVREDLLQLIANSALVQKYDPSQPRDPKGSETGGQWSAASGVVVETAEEKADRLKRAEKMGFDTKHTWYHGTFQKFEEFDPAKGNPDAYFGKALYFSSSEDDVQENYTEPDSPDWSNKVEALIEQRQSQWQDDNPDASIEQRDEAFDKIDQQVRDELFGEGKGIVLKTYLRMEKPLDLTSASDTIPLGFDEATGKYEPESLGAAFQALDRYVDDHVYGGSKDKYYQKGRQAIFQTVLEEGEINPGKLHDLFRNADGFHNLDGKDGRAVFTGDLFRQFVQSMGYDGIILNASATWPSIVPGRNVRHAIVFKPNQVRSVTAKFDPKNKESGNILKFDPNQPRVPAGQPGGGQWTDGDTIEGFFFGSPNEDNLTFDRAVAQLKGGDADRAVAFARSVKSELGVDADHATALGVWADGAEPSIMSTIYSNIDGDTLDYASALFGKQFNQKAVLNFKVDSKGTDTLYRFDDGTDLAKAKAVLDSKGIEYKTLALNAGHVQVVVFEQGGETLINKVADAAKEFHGKVKLFKGSGRFVGGDGESRESAINEYDRIIQGYEVSRPGQRGTGERLVTRKGVYFAVRKAEVADRIIGPFTSFATRMTRGVEGMAQLVSNLQTSRVSAYGFTAEAEVLDVQTYAISEQLDKLICPICEEMHGRRFSVQDARDALEEILHTKDPEAIKELQPWPKQDAASLARFREYSNADLVERNWHIPPYHPNCRGILVHVGKVPPLKGEPGPAVIHITTPDSLPLVTTADMFRALNLPVPSQKQLDFWNREIGIYPSEFLASMLGVPHDEVALLDLATTARFSLKPDDLLAEFEFVGDVKDLLDGVGALFSFNFKDRSVDVRTLTMAQTGDDQSAAIKTLLASEMALFQRLGLKQVSIEANIDVGAYAFARYGFLPSKDEWDKIRRQMELDLNTKYSDSLSTTTLRILLMALHDADPKAMWVVADMGEKIGTESIGKLLLLGRAWRGFLDFDDDEALERLGHYLDL